MSNATSAIEKVLAVEGGYVNHPADKGGPTNYGITQATYQAYKKRPVSIQEMIDMPIADAIAIYKAKYWDAIGGDYITSYAVAYSLFDQAVNRGVDTVIKNVQELLGLSKTGTLSNDLISKLNSIDPSSFIDSFIARSEQAYRAIVANNPSQAVFLEGWLHRLSSLKFYTTIQLNAVVSAIRENPIIFALPALVVVGLVGYYYFTDNKKGYVYGS